MRVSRCIHTIIFGFALCLSNTEAQGQRLEDVLSMDLVIHFVDVGVGDAILIEIPDRTQEIVIDGGDRRFGYSFSDYVRPYIDGDIDLAIITHSDFDHWSGIKALMDRGHRIREIWDPGYDRSCKFTGRNAARKRQRDQYLKFIRSLAALPAEQLRLRRPVPTHPTRPLFARNGVELRVLHAEAEPEGDDCSYIVNNASAVVRLQYKQVVFLFTGDINGKERLDRGDTEPKYIEAKLLELNDEYPGILNANVLKVPHHGSETANTRKFIQAVAPRFAVISSSYTAHYQLPKRRVVQRYQRIRFEANRKIEKVLRTNFGETNFDSRRFGDDHIICGTNGQIEDLICGYIWSFEQ